VSKTVQCETIVANEVVSDLSNIYQTVSFPVTLSWPWPWAWPKLSFKSSSDGAFSKANISKMVHFRDKVTIARCVIGNHMQAIKWYQFRYLESLNVTGTQMSRAQHFWKSNVKNGARKSHSYYWA